MNGDIALRNVSVRFIAQTVADEWHVPYREMVGPGRRADLVEARNIVCWLARTITGKTYQVIGRAIGDRDHTTVLRSFNIIEAARASDPAFKERLDAVCAGIEIVALSRLRAAAAEPDAIAAARRIVGSPAQGSVDASTLEVAAMATQLLSAHDIIKDLVAFLATRKRIARLIERGRFGGSHYRDEKHHADSQEAMLISELEAAGFSLTTAGEIDGQETGPGRDCARAAE